MSNRLSLSDALAQARDAAVAVELGPLTTLRLDGGAAREALQRVVSQDVSSLAEGELRLALLLAAKGQFRAVMAVGIAAGRVVLTAPAGREDGVRDGLARYLALSRVAVEQVSWPGGAVAVLGPEAATIAPRLAPGAAPGRVVVHESPTGQLLACGEAFIGAPAVVLGCSTREQYGEVLWQVAAAGVPHVPRELLELERIRRGFPAWGAELTDTVLPPEVGLDERAISYAKGCYVGQETMARMKSYGHPNRTLIAVRQRRGADDPPALPLPLSAEGEEKVRGELTSTARTPGLGVVGLALVRRELAAPGTVLVGADRAYEVTALPLW